jgi:hypothetical protein
MQRVTVTKLRIGDCEDPELYLAETANKFLNHSEPGAWLKSQGLTCGYSIGHEKHYYGYVVTLFTEMTEEQWTEYRLRWQ